MNKNTVFVNPAEIYHFPCGWCNVALSMINHDSIPPLDVLSLKLQQLFDIDKITGMHLLSGGHLCKNFILKSPEKKYFLKRYRHKVSETVNQIKHAEQYFSDQGIPVVLPIKDVHGRAAFFVDHNWYSLFPFWSNPPKDVRDLDDNALCLLGEFLARIHEAGKDVGREIQPVLLWDRERFFLEVKELELVLEQQPVLSKVERQIKSLLKIKREFVESNTLDIHDFDLPYDTIIHCDFSYQNVFFSEDGLKIEAVFDFEKASIGPRAFEVARSMFVCCFDDGWEQRNIDQAIVFISAYIQKQPLSLGEFQQGVKMYLVNLAHQTWVEAKVLLKNSVNYIDLLEAHERRITHLPDDMDAFAKDIYEKAQK